MKKFVWVIESFNDVDWEVESIHYTRAAARRQRQRYAESGIKVRLQKYVPVTYKKYNSEEFKELDSLEERVAALAKAVDAAFTRYAADDVSKLSGGSPTEEKAPDATDAFGGVKS